MIEQMRDICDSSNIGMLGLEMLATPSFEKMILRSGYAYSFFMENVDANIHWRGPFDDDVTHNLDFNHSGKFTNALLTGYGYAKESKSNTGMRQAYGVWAKERPAGVANLYPDHVGIGVKPKANGTGKRFYHVFKQPLHSNIVITNEDLFNKTIRAINAFADDYERECRLDR